MPARLDGHQHDLSFIDRVKAASLDSLFIMWTFHLQPNAPMWKRVAIRRAIQRLGAEVPVEQRCCNRCGAHRRGGKCVTPVCRKTGPQHCTSVAPCDFS